MKPKLKWLVIAGWLGAATAGAQPVSYVISNTPRWNLIAVQLNHPSGNNIRNAISNAPIGSVLRKFNLTTHAWEVMETFTANNWMPGTTILRPGEGAYFSNANATANFNMPITGYPTNPILPVINGNNLVLRARQTNDIATFTNIMGYPPNDGCVLLRFLGAGRDPFTYSTVNYGIYAFWAGAWRPTAPPPIRVGESVWVGTNGSPPVITQQPTKQEVCLSNSATFSVTVSQPLPLQLTYLWRSNNITIPSATNNVFTIPQVRTTSGADIMVFVTNPFGTVTSDIAKLSVLPPTTAAGPANVAGCAGSTVTLTTTAGGSGPFTYAWFRNGQLIPNASGNSWNVGPLSVNNTGTYCVVVSGLCGTVTNCAEVKMGDTEKPVLICPNSISLPCDGSNGNRATWTVTITDNCDTNPTYACLPPSGSSFTQGTTPVVCRGWDDSGNTNTCSFTVTVTDVPPTITCPDDMTVNATSPAGAVVTYTVTASDPCETNLTVTCDPPSGSLFAIGTTKVYCLATDPQTNSALCSFNITVNPWPCCDGKEWAQLNPKSPPSPRHGHAMAYHAATAGVLLFGGTNHTGVLADTTVFYGSEWLSGGGLEPSARAFAAMAYDARRARVVLFGGTDGTNAMGDTWEWDGNDWFARQVTGPSPRHSHAMAYDATRQRVVLYGGWIPTLGRPSDETWEYDGTNWILAPIGNQPGPRYGHALAWDGARVILFGGAGTNTVHGDTWRWMGDKWTLATTNGPSPRRFHAMAYDSTCDRVVLFGGGITAASALADTWEWNRTEWTDRTRPGPSTRWQHALADHAARQQALLFGGYHTAVTGSGPVNDTWAWRGEHTPPSVLSVSALCEDDQIVVTFSEPVDPASAENSANYALTCGAAVIVDIELDTDAQTVYLTTAPPIPTGFNCSLVISGVSDLCGNTMDKSTNRFACTPDPCPRGSTGRDYWLTFPGNYAPAAIEPPHPQLFITGEAGTRGIVTIPGLATPFTAEFTIDGSGVAIVNLPREADLGDANDVVQPRGIHVRARRKVSVYGHHHVTHTSDSFLGLATESLGRSYRVLTYQNVFQAVPELNAVQFAIVGTVDNTTVIIRPSTNVLSHPGGRDYVVMLNRGDTYQLRNTHDLPADLTGTLILADQPIGVFGSHRCANIPDTNVYFCDYLVEQLIPTELWGNNFVAMPLKDRGRPDTFRMLALFKDTRVTINGVDQARLLDSGQYLEHRSATHVPLHITSDKPLLVAQYANSSDYSDPPLETLSDPFMALIPPTTHFASSYVIQTPTSGFSRNYVNLMVQAAEVGQIRLDGVLLAAGEFDPIHASGYWGVQVAVTPGPHVIASTRDVPFGLIAYGWGLYDSYGYPGAVCRGGGGQSPGFTCPPTNLTAQAGANCVATVPDLAGEVGNADWAVAILQDPPAGTLVGPGVYIITTTIIDQFGGEHVCTSKLTVQMTTGPGLRCPANIETNCVSAEGTVVLFTPGLCNTNFTVACLPPSGSVFPVGTMEVDCEARSGSTVLEKCSFTVTVLCPSMSVSLAGTLLTVSWTEGGQLQKAESPAGPWQTISNATNPYRFNITPQNRKAFFRIVK